MAHLEVQTFLQAAGRDKGQLKDKWCFRALLKASVVTSALAGDAPTTVKVWSRLKSHYDHMTLSSCLAVILRAAAFSESSNRACFHAVATAGLLGPDGQTSELCEWDLQAVVRDAICYGDRAMLEFLLRRFDWTKSVDLDAK